MHLHDFAIPVFFSLLLGSTEPPSRAGQAFLALLETPVEPARPPVIADMELPGEDALLEALVDYWSGVYSGTLAPSINLQERLLDACEQDPSRTMKVLRWLPKTPAAHHRIERIWQSMAGDESDECSEKACLKDWLMYNTSFFREELIKQAWSTRTSDGESFNYQGRLALEALVQLDWSEALKILWKLECSPEPLRRVMALGLHYAHEMETNSPLSDALRLHLLRAAEDPNQGTWIRKEAFDALLDKPWDGWEAWYLERFKEAELANMRDGNIQFNPLISPIHQSPERWIPTLGRMMEGPDRILRDNAVACLLSLPDDRISAECLRPMLPWLSDPEWSSAECRYRLIFVLQHFDLPEAIPGAIWVLEHSVNPFERSSAAGFLIRNPAPSAIPALRSVAGCYPDRPFQAFGRGRILAALAACGGMEDEECAECIASYLQVSSLLGNPAESSAPAQCFDEKTVIGRHLLSNCEVRPLLARACLKRARSQEDRHPRESENLRKEVWKWDVPEADQELIRRLNTSIPLLSDLQAAVNRRTSLVAHHQDELAKFSMESGWRAGLASVLLEDSDRSNILLTKSDNETRVAILATARMLHFPLDFGKVALLSLRNRDLALAADRYLKAFQAH